jgi:hypothetical protein
MEVLALKLVTGEDVLGELKENYPHDGVTLINPVAIQVVRGQDGRPNVGFAPFPLHSVQESGSEITLDNIHIVYSYTPAEDFVENYSKIFGSGLIVPNQGIITE